VFVALWQSAQQPMSQSKIVPDAVEVQPMRYCKYDDAYSELDGGVTYVETNDGWYVRQATLNGSQHLASNINDPRFGMRLAEGQISYDDLDANDITEIPKDEFEAVWDMILASHAATWRRSKARYALGSPVQGTLLIFYPQGVMVKLDHETIGIADHAACDASTTPEHMYPGHTVTAIVAGYDEQQHWITLGEPIVHEKVV
jgi:hypothetical protein